MATLKTQLPRLPTLKATLTPFSRPLALPPAPTLSSKRITGRQLQARRLRVWTACPYCAGCGDLTIFPHGFDLDHRVPLYQGGPDTDENCQILCNGPDGCHDSKTKRDGSSWQG